MVDSEFACPRVHKLGIKRLVQDAGIEVVE
jgi:hypothetical protein